VDVSARRYRYVGLERDDETGLYAMGARYYAAWLGRWTSADPLGIGADGPGVYNYTRGSPVVYVDPGGMKEEHSHGRTEGLGPAPSKSQRPKTFTSMTTLPSTRNESEDGYATSRTAGDQRSSFSSWVDVGESEFEPDQGPVKSDAQFAQELIEIDRKVGEALVLNAANKYEEARAYGIMAIGAAILTTLGGQAAGSTVVARAAGATVGAVRGALASSSTLELAKAGAAEALLASAQELVSGATQPALTSSEQAAMPEEEMVLAGAPRPRPSMRVNVGGDGPRTRGGETPAAAAGREAHKNYGTALGPDYRTEVPLPSGKRADAVSKTKPEVRELKPDNPKAIRRGEKQAAAYAKELEANDLLQRTWKWFVDTYRPRKP
jgi:RHS repeat-associated protein